jgi:hypothetical protein
VKASNSHLYNKGLQNQQVKVEVLLQFVLPRGRAMLNAHTCKQTGLLRKFLPLSWQLSSICRHAIVFPASSLSAIVLNLLYQEFWGPTFAFHSIIVASHTSAFGAKINNPLHFR